MVSTSSFVDDVMFSIACIIARVWRIAGTTTSNVPTKSCLTIKTSKFSSQIESHIDSEVCMLSTIALCWTDALQCEQNAVSTKYLQHVRVEFLYT